MSKGRLNPERMRSIIEESEMCEEEFIGLKPKSEKAYYDYLNKAHEIIHNAVKTMFGYSYDVHVFGMSKSDKRVFDIAIDGNPFICRIGQAYQGCTDGLVFGSFIPVIDLMWVNPDTSEITTIKSPVDYGFIIALRKKGE